MADVFSKIKRSQVMAAIRSTGNKDTEVKLARLLRKQGITGWRRKQRVFGKPDFVFRKPKVAIFVDGCFWHGCPIHGRKPESNSSYWLPKLLRNRQRDIMVKRELVKSGWTVIRLWEHDLSKPSSCINKISKLVNRARNGLKSHPK